MNRKHLLSIAESASREAAKTWNPRTNSTYRHSAEAVVDALLPQITKAEQLKDIPERSIVVVSVTGGGQPMEWRNGYLLDTLLNDEPQDPEWLITHYGPLTVVWQP